MLVNLLLYLLDALYTLPPELFSGCVDGPIESDMTLFLSFMFSFSFMSTFIWVILLAIKVFKKTNGENEHC